METLRTLDDPRTKTTARGLEIINNETARLYNMVEELLDFSRLQNGRIRMDCRPLDLVAELTDAVLFCEATHPARRACMLVYNEPEEMIPVYADPDRLRQVFINIMDNAIKYSAPGGRITVKIWAGEYKAFTEIIDQGPRHPAGGSGKRQDQVLQGQQLGAGQRHRPCAGGFHYDRAGRHP